MWNNYCTYNSDIQPRNRAMSQEIDSRLRPGVSKMLRITTKEVAETGRRDQPREKSMPMVDGLITAESFVIVKIL
ncbi:hypothetical protein Bpfe_008467 [Biomphalaria pfeifferi]|uniref:Uncharacterized protein n=1 Tax=Biomphalaria pfeifferi TaxID=112525 RepID=A0AAD8BY52_BIOPF|nr:hypothetical protein Bpfe_008467 [Biomphalaria pfeifferi]